MVLVKIVMMITSVKLRYSATIRQQNEGFGYLTYVKFAIVIGYDDLLRYAQNRTAPPSGKRKSIPQPPLLI